MLRQHPIDVFARATQVPGPYAIFVLLVILLDAVDILRMHLVALLLLAAVLVVVCCLR
jgi:hypothetical protein